MKKKKLFLLASLAAALAMTSCSSFDEPAALDGDGMPLTRAVGDARQVWSEEDLLIALTEQVPEIAIAGDFTVTEDVDLDYPVVIYGTSGKTLTTTASIICTADVTFKNLTIDATTPVGTGAITMGNTDIHVVLDNTKLTQNRAGIADGLKNVGIAIQNLFGDNTLEIKNNSEIILPGNYVRAVNMYTADRVSSVNLSITDSHITCGNNLSLPSTYARGLNFDDVCCDNLVIKNSTIKGAYYVVNVVGASKVIANVTNGSVLDGRAAFNIWAPGFEANVIESTLIGRNNYSGPTETFANIVINQDATGCTLNLTNTIFKMDVATKQQANSQYAVSFRASNQTLNLIGSLDIYSTPGNDVNSFFSANAGVENITINQQKLTSFNVYEIESEDI